MFSHQVVNWHDTLTTWFLRRTCQMKACKETFFLWLKVRRMGDSHNSVIPNTTYYRVHRTNEIRKCRHVKSSVYCFWCFPFGWWLFSLLSLHYFSFVAKAIIVVHPIVQTIRLACRATRQTTYSSGIEVVKSERLVSNSDRTWVQPHSATDWTDEDRGESTTFQNELSCHFCIVC